MISPRAFVVLVALLFALPLNLATAASAPKSGAKSIADKPESSSPTEPSSATVEDMLGAVVRVRMKAIADARSSVSLGDTREGTGVVIDDRGHIVTIGYIVIEADSIEVTTQDNRTLPATLVGYDHASGFGLLRASVPLKTKPMAMGDASALSTRDPVMIVPANGREAASVAYVVSRRKFAGSWEYLLDDAIFTSPPTLQWAGAALVNREGQLVGIGSLLVRNAASPDTQLPGNMFVPIDLLKPILPELIAKGRRSAAPRPWLGLATEEVQGHLFVTRVSPDGPADKAGIRNGDIVLGVGGKAVKSHEEFYRGMWSSGAAGVEIPLKVLQGSEPRDIRVRSIDRFQYFREKPTY